MWRVIELKKKIREEKKELIKNKIKMGKYTEYFKIGFKKSIEYKSYLIGALVTPLFMGFFFYFIWSYIFEVKSKGVAGFEIGGFTFEEMIIYLVIGLLIQTAKQTEISERISATIKSGDISIFLCRPVNFVKSLLSDGIGEKLIPFGTFVILLAIVTNLFAVKVPTITILVIFAIYGLLLIFFQIIIDVMIGGLAFWLTEIWGIRSSIQQILWILSGRALPLSLFPQMMQRFLAWTPFLYLEYTFASIYLMKLSIEEALRAMGIFMIWILILLVLMRWLYARGFAKLESFGG